MTMPETQIWSAVSEEFGRLHGNQVRDLWLGSAHPHSFHRGLLTLEVANASAKEAIDSCYRGELESLIFQFTGSPVRVRTRIAPEELEEAAAEAAGDAEATDRLTRGADGRAGSRRPRRQVVPRTGPSVFARHAANELAHRAVEEFVGADAESVGCNPLFVHGPAGCGKTALAGEALRGLRERDPDCDPLVLSGESLGRDVVRATRARTFGAVQRSWAEHDVIVLDEAHRLRGQNVAQTVAVSLIGPVLARGGRVLVLSRHAPKDMHGLGERLRSHFENGLVVGMRQPDGADRLAVLRAASAGLPAPVEEAALEAVSERCPGTLTEAVALLEEASAANGGGIVRTDDVEERLVRTGRGMRSIGQLVDLVCEETGVCKDRLRSSEKSRDVARYRHLCVYLASRSLGLSARHICRSMRLKSPSIVAYSRRAVERRRATDPKFEELIHVLQARLSGAQRDFEW